MRKEVKGPDVLVRAARIMDEGGGVLPCDVAGGGACRITITVADKQTGKVVGKPYWGKPDLRFDEGA